MARGEVPPPPTRADVERKISGLLDGSASRDEVSEWAMHWVDAQDPGDMEEVVWNALNNLAGADAPTTDRRYLYERADFEAWLEEARAG